MTEAVQARLLKLSIETNILDVVRGVLFSDLSFLYSEDQRVNYKIHEASASDLTVLPDPHITHRDESGMFLEGYGNSDWPAYRLNKVLNQGQRQPNQDLICLLRDELLVDILTGEYQLAGITFVGKTWRDGDIRATARLIRRQLPRRSIVVDPDYFSDNLNNPNLQRAFNIFSSEGIHCFAARYIEFQGNPPESTLDNEDQSDTQEDSSTSSEDIIYPHINQMVLYKLYGSQKVICVDNVLYVWCGTYYEQRSDSEELGKIADFLNTYDEDKRIGRSIVKVYPHAKVSTVKEALDWIKFRHTVKSELINPPGLNCTNGVLKIIWNDFYPSWALLPHSPDFYYTYEPKFTFDSTRISERSEQCDKLLQVLDEAEREIFLRVIAASLDLETVRRRKGRTVRALLLKGLGNNGKDALREVVSLMYGHQGMTSTTIIDFKSYDNGRKFNLASLIRSRVNWASENANVSNIDKIQSLKAFITGDPLEHERKNKDSYEFRPKGICIFNCNDTPNILASIEAIKSRFAIIRFNKTFKENADPSKGEIEADPRFRYDQRFLQDEVLPAFINYVLQELRNLIDYGINYACSDMALKEVRLDNSHLLQFCEDKGLDYQTGGFVQAKDLWERLKQWYIDNDTLQVIDNVKGKPKYDWTPQANPNDLNVKGANQVIPRFLELFPRAKRGTTGGNVQGISGIGFKNRGSERPRVQDQSPPVIAIPAQEVDSGQ